MKKSELVKIIREAVKDELKSCIPALLNEYLGKQTNNTKINTLQEDVDLVEMSKKKVKKARENINQKTFCKNPTLNKILNETVGGIPQEGSRVTDGATHNKKMTDLNGNEVNIDQLPNHVSSALTRDYSKLLKKVDEKKQGIVK